MRKYKHREEENRSKKSPLAQTPDNRQSFEIIDNEVKQYLREKKKLSYIKFCNSLNPSMGSREIWSKVRAFSSSTQPLRTNLCSDPNSKVFVDLQNELVREKVMPINLLAVVGINDDEKYNGPISPVEFYAALELIKKDTASGLDSILNSVIKHLPRKTKNYLLSIFNRFFSLSIFTKVIFLPIPNGKGYRPISLTSALCKLFERLINRRLEHYIESINAIPVQQFAFPKRRSTTDCVSTLVTDIHQGFIRGKHTFVLAIDLKEAFSNILLKAIYDRLVELRTPDKILNFVSFLIQSKNLFFTSDTGNPKTSYIKVP